MTNTRDNHFWIGLDIGGTKLLAAAVSNDLEILDLLKIGTLRDEGPDAVMGRVLSLCHSLICKHGQARGVGAGFAGLVDWQKGNVLSSIILPGWDGYPIGCKLSEALNGLPVFVDNDATAAGYGEFLLLGAPSDLNMVLLTIGTGIGGAIILNGRLYRGATGTSAEFGNTTIDWQGRKCWCGNRGCLNMLASGSAISAKAAELAEAADYSTLKGQPNPIPVEQIKKAARLGDAVAIQALDEGARALGAGVANVINIFNPDRVVLTGGVSDLGEAYLDTVIEEAGKRAFSESMAHVKIAFSTLGPEVGALGAAGLIRDHIMNR
ncbi:MAG: ROK family protein [Planctomycetota bacterium]